MSCVLWNVSIFSMQFVVCAPEYLQLKTWFYIISCINIVSKVFCVVSRFWRHHYHWRSLCDSHTFHFLPSINCPETSPLHTELSCLISWEELECFFFPPKYFLSAPCRFFWPLTERKSLFNYPNSLCHQINGNIWHRPSKFVGVIFWFGNSCFNIFSISGEKLKTKLLLQTQIKLSQLVRLATFFQVYSISLHLFILYLFTPNTKTPKLSKVALRWAMLQHPLILSCF